MKVFREYIPTEREYGPKVTCFDNHLFDVVAVIIQQIDYFICRIPIHISCQFQMQTIAVSMMNDSKI